MTDKKIEVSAELGADVQALFSQMSPELFTEMLLNTLEKNGAKSFAVQKGVVMDGETPRFSYWIELRS